MAKSIIITGSTGYFGRYFVKSLSKKFNVFAVARDERKLSAICEETGATPVVLDLYDSDSIQVKISGICKENSVYGLINNAFDFSSKTGFNTPNSKFEQLSLDSMRATFDSGVLAPLQMTQIVGNSMIESQIKGSIVNISSMYGLVAPDYRLYNGKTVFNPITYGMAKAALNAMTRYLASFWGQHGIRCNSIAPGSFPNTETDSVNAPSDDEFLRRLENKTTLGRTGHPNDLLGILNLLLSDESAYITGQVIAVDGGWTII
jgi:NAD(P)-dependent dehydrogenase (short-subunit alcohol dehydrogenase family)